MEETFETIQSIFGGMEQDPYTIAVRAYVWGYPLVSSATFRLALTRAGSPPIPRAGTDAGAPLNQMGHGRELFDSSSKGIGPNNDTLYSLAWIDLNDEPFILVAPDFGERYYTFQMALADTSTAMSPGQRTHGGQLPPVFIYGPSYRGALPSGMLGIPSLTRYLLIAGRILVEGPEDLQAVHALQNQIRLCTWTAYEEDRTGPNQVPEQRPLLDPAQPVDKDFEFLTKLGNVLRDWVVTEVESKLVESFAKIGLTPECGFEPDSLTREAIASIIRGLADGKKAVERKSLNLGTNINGWTINYKGPRFGEDYLLRAAVAKDQRHVALPEEAIFPLARVDANGLPLDGSQSYRIKMSQSQLPPVNAFWSITVYDDRGSMVENPIDRYSIGDRTPGLKIGNDGSIEIRLQNEAPPSSKNWLPTPAKDPFYLMMRLFIPRKDVFDKTWLPPKIEQVTGTSN